ncbi:MAG: nucleotidyl transferase AbiEii/AbiGii toxin family protein [Actinomycetota bacterium]
MIHRFRLYLRDRTELDLAWDFRMRELRRTELGLVLDRDELAADKMLALYGRAEARDFVDVFRLREHYTRVQLFALAREKDLGFVEEAFVSALASIGRRDRIEFDVDDIAFNELETESADWRAELEA